MKIKLKISLDFEIKFIQLAELGSTLSSVLAVVIPFIELLVK